MKKKILLWVLLLSWMGVIFLFSAQNADTSSSLSSGFLHRFVLIFLPEQAARNEELVHTLEFLIRKGAHMTEYAILAILASAQLRQYFPPYLSENIPKKQEWKPKSFRHHPFFQFLLTLCFIFLYACTDEFHQRFVNGRSGQFTDVCIDTLGGFLGCLLFLLCSRLLRRRSKI